MDIQTCTKYTEFLTNECNKKLQDGKITSEELIELSNEIKRFKEKVKESDIVNPKCQVRVDDTKEIFNILLRQNFQHLMKSKITIFNDATISVTPHQT